MPERLTITVRAHELANAAMAWGSGQESAEAADEAWEHWNVAWTNASDETRREAMVLVSSRLRSAGRLFCDDIEPLR